MAKRGKREADQVQRFVDAARQIGCDEDKERFEVQLGKIAKAASRRRPGVDSLSKGPEERRRK